LYVSISFNADIDGIGAYHDIEATITRYGDFASAIATDGAMRVYGISPKSGPEAGGTLITVSGQFFSNYCNTHYCNALHCHFIYPKAGGITIYAVDATFVDDKTLKCVSPRAVPEVWDAQVQVAVDMNRACSTTSDDPLKYNQMQFVYQTDRSATAIPPEAVRDRNVHNAPYRLQGEWIECIANTTEQKHICFGWPGISEDQDKHAKVPNLGYYSCLGGFYSEDRQDASVKYPVWCLRALPLNGATSYLVTFHDPFLNTAASIVRPVPTKYPGFCHRTNHHFGWDKMSLNLDYRYFDLHDKNYSRGDIPVPGKITQGRNLIDRLWSTTAIHFTIPYMRDVMHRIGEKYGFIDVGTVFSISFDITLAQTFDEKQLRRNQRCAKPPATFAPYSGELGDEGSAGSYVNWTAYAWDDGKAACSVNSLWEGQCEHEIVKSPNKEDDTGVMLTKPSSLEIVQTVDDQVLGCPRMRISFACSTFTKSKCVGELVARDINSARYRNTGSRQEYSSFDSWCFFMYPEVAGPNNPNEGGWNASAPVQEDWRYLYRHSPCVRCSQAAEVFDALHGVDSIVDGIPGPLEHRGYGDKDSTVEISLGCFGDAVEDECCDDALDDQPGPPVRGKCPRSLERCVRARTGHLCAKDDNRDGECNDRATSEWPLCAPRGLV